MNTRRRLTTFLALLLANCTTQGPQTEQPAPLPDGTSIADTPMTKQHDVGTELAAVHDQATLNSPDTGGPTVDVAATTTKTLVDICIYGGSSAAVTAAVAAKAQGATVLLIEPGLHVGGMSANGLGSTDIGSKTAITGLAADFYKKIGKFYGSTQPEYFFEPHAAEAVFAAQLKDAGIDVIYSARVAQVSVIKKRIEVATFESTAAPHKVVATVQAKVFIDASYEGDLMAKAGVTFAVGREANAQFGETLDGVQQTSGHQFPAGIDPYVIAGDPTSGLLPGINPTPKAPNGTGDAKVQAYNFRLCMTQNPVNRLPFPAPTAYAPANYELLGRVLAKGALGQLKSLVNPSPIKNGKADWNNNGPVSTDFIGGNWGFPNASYGDRAVLTEAHRQWMLGLFHFLATDARVPSGVKAELATWGLCKDEFVDNGGWPHRLYIREARRMVGELVMTELHCAGKLKANEVIAYGSYNMDSHNCQRVVVNGEVKNEGDVQVGVPGPYGIGYRAITPKASEVENLLVPVCLSATHIAYGSIRMEPVFMALGEAAGVAAALAISAGNAIVQQVDVDKLRAVLGFEAPSTTTVVGNVQVSPGLGSWTAGPPGPANCMCAAATPNCHAIFRGRVTTVAGNDATLEFSKFDGTGPSVDVAYWVVAKTTAPPACMSNAEATVRASGTWPAATVLSVKVPIWPSQAQFDAAPCGDVVYLHVVSGGSDDPNAKTWFQGTSLRFEKLCSAGKKWTVSSPCPNGSTTASYSCPGGIVMTICGILDSQGNLTVVGGKPDGSTFSPGAFTVRQFGGAAAGAPCTGSNQVKATLNLTATEQTKVTFPPFSVLGQGDNGTHYCIAKDSGGNPAFFCSGELVVTDK